MTGDRNNVYITNQRSEEIKIEQSCKGSLQPLQLRPIYSILVWSKKSPYFLPGLIPPTGFEPVLPP